MTLLLWLLILPPTFLTGWFAVEILAGVPRSRGEAPGPGNTPRAVIVVPAHDEAKIIDVALRALTSAARGVAEILLIADNCTDDTAQIARRRGVTVSERSDAERRGKGFALAHAQALLMAAPPEVVVVLDADCTIDGASLRALIAATAGSRRPSQAINLLRAPARPRSPLVALSSFAFLIKNLLRQRGLQRLAGSVHLTGTGMALPWTLFATAPLATASIVEDLKLGIDLAAAGHAPQLVPGAIVWSDPSTVSGTMIQRRRWETGFIATAAKAVPALLAAALRRGSGSLLCLAFDLCIPPLALLIATAMAFLTCAVIATLVLGAGWAPASTLAAALLIAGTALLIAWWREGRGFVSLGELARIPFYMLWKLPLYLGLRRAADGPWLRTGR